MGPVLRGGSLRPPDSGAAHADPQAAVALGGGADRGLDRLGLGHVRLDEARPPAQLGGERGALLGGEIGDHHRGARFVQRPHGRRAEPRRAAGDER